MKPIISVVVPVWNEESTLSACLASLTNQHTDIPYEVIVVDKQSTDKSRIITRSYPNVVLVTEKRRGRAQARSAGIRAAKGEIIALAEGDCTVWIPSGKIRTDPLCAIHHGRNINPKGQRTSSTISQGLLVLCNTTLCSKKTGNEAWYPPVRD